MHRRSLVRLADALRGHSEAFRGLALDPDATAQAIAVTAVASALAQLSMERSIGALVLGAVSGSVGLIAWSTMLWVLAAAVGSRAPLMSILRPIGIAAAPFALMGAPVVGPAAAIWSIFLQVAAMRHGAGLGTFKALSVVIVPWILLVSLVPAVLTQG